MSNNNRNNNNRRRGRGNNRSQGGGQLNRIDSRARGNAPQLLEKYKKLAHDSALNGDRVQAEYYLQFADHYFRVIADSRVPKDEQQRGPRREFDREGGEEQDYFDEEFDRGQRQEPRRREEPAAEEASEEAAEGPRVSEAPQYEGEEYEPSENPFTRPARAAKPRRPRRGRSDEGDDVGNRLDPSVLPGAIARTEIAEEPAEEREEERSEEAKPASRRGLKPRSRSRRTNDDDEELEAVG